MGTFPNPCNEKSDTFSSNHIINEEHLVIQDVDGRS